MIRSAYVHIPFCKKICSYCDFCKFIYNEEWVKKYLESLEYEIECDYKNDILKTVYIGGGTPSSLNSEDLKKLLNICSKFKLENEYEYTIEFNIDDIDEQKLKICKDFGINRISIGVQSFNKNNLSFLGRNINIDIDKKIKLTKKYFNNINIDLIYALPNQTIEQLSDDLDKFINLSIPHISCYSLIIEKHTMLNNMNIKPIDEDLDFEMYNLINKKLKKYDHYEISNYALPGYESKHNLTYWNNEEYYGFGVGASSYINDKRINNSKNIVDYMNKKYNKDEENVSIEEKISLELILGFRKTKGINIDEFNRKYNKNIFELYNIKELLDDDKLVLEDNNLFINKKYLYLSNEILVNFV